MKSKYDIKGGLMKKLFIVLAIILCTGIAANAAQVEIVCVLDKSGSMQVVQDDIIGSFNTFLSNQQQSTPDAMLTLVLFDTDIVSKRRAIKEFEPLSSDHQYRPEGWTALYDAIGTTITDLESTVTPETIVIFAIITDGLENSSKEYTSKEIKYRISHYESWHPWTFLYLAANQDAFVESQKIGIPDMNWINVDLSTSAGCIDTFGTLTNTVTTIIDGGVVDLQDHAITVPQNK